MISALLLGLAGSLHCVGMCGPLLLALPLGAAERRRVLTDSLQYHSGRLLTYAVLGSLLGSVGYVVFWTGFQQLIALFAAFSMFFMALLSWRFERFVTALPGLGNWTRRVQAWFRHTLQHSGSLPLLGMLNGLLPCGMVYAALAGALATGSAWQGGLFMLLFGLGTLPLLLAVSVAGGQWGRALRSKVRLLQPVLLVLAGILILQRSSHIDWSWLYGVVPAAQMDCH
jgi:uncharacterized protein